jgi:hypothetical protein
MQMTQRTLIIISCWHQEAAYFNSLKEEQQKLTTFGEADPKEHLTPG